MCTDLKFALITVVSIAVLFAIFGCVVFFD